jgi:hypothetical protein
MIKRATISFQRFGQAIKRNRLSGVFPYVKQQAFGQ